MKRLFFIILGLIAFNSTLNAAVYPYSTKCPQWEHGQIVYYNGVQQNVNGSTPPLEFCWDATRIEGMIKYDGTFYEYEELLTANQTIFNWYGYYIYNMYGEDYIGLFVRVVVMGYEQKTPIVRLNSTTGVLVQKNDILSPSGSIWNGYEYIFFINKMPLSIFTGNLNELGMAGELKVYSGSNTSILKDSVYIN